MAKRNNQKLPDELLQAVMDDDRSRVEQLLAEGANPNAEGSRVPLSALRYATMKGKTAMVELLSAALGEQGGGAKPSVQVFHSACLEGNLQLVKTLLSAGADANGLVSDENPELDRRSPLMQACAGKSETLPNLVRLLLDSGADVNARDRLGRTALMHFIGSSKLRHALALRRSGSTSPDDCETLQLLAGAGADVAAKDEVGVTALVLSRRVQNAVAEKFLLQCGAALSEGDGDLVHEPPPYPSIMDAQKSAPTTWELPDDAQLLIRTERGADPGNRVRI